MSAPRAVYLTSATVYPFLLLTAITSLALNLSYARQSNHQKTQALTAQITVLSDILTTLAATPLPPSGPLRAAQLDAIDKNLQMVGLREGAAAPVVDPTTWREVLLGKKGKQFTDNDEAEPDWATIYKEATEADQQALERSTAPPSFPPPPQRPTPEQATIHKVPQLKESKPTLATYL